MLLAITSCCKFTKELQQTQMMKWMDEYDALHTMSQKYLEFHL